MEIKSCSYKTKCDLGGCKNLAEYSIFNKNETKSSLNICQDCSKELFSVLGKINVPKSIPAPFKNQKKIKMEAK